MQTQNAIDYIREKSSFYSNDRYKWLGKLIDLTLEEKLTNDKIKDIVNEVLQIEDEEIDKDLQTDEIADHEDSVEQIINVKKINSINNLSNIGLLDIDEDVKIKDGLNVFFGKNGSGKSSVYLGLCKALGYDKIVISNINREQNNSSCKIVLYDNDDNEHIIEWETGIECSQTNVQIFDSQKSNSIVQNDQLNQFELAHLKKEYFSFLHDMYDKISNLLKDKLTLIKQNQYSIEKIIKNNVPQFWDSEQEYTKEIINEIEFNEEDQKILAGYENEIESLRITNLDAVIRNIKTANKHVKTILNILGKVEKIADKENDENHNLDWIFVYNDEYFNEINKKMEDYNTAKNAFEKSGKNKLSSLIPQHWITDSKWDLFISKSIEFLNSLKKDEKIKYSEDNCPYCHQLLENEEAKELLNIYHELRDEHKEKFEELECEFEELLSESKTIETKLNSIDNNLIEEELTQVGITKPIEKVDPKNIFTNIKNALSTYTKIKNTKLTSDKLKEYWDIYMPIHEAFSSKTEELNDSLQNKKEKIEELEIKVKPLKKYKVLFDNNETILNYIENNELIKQINERLSDLTEIKKATSNCETQFSKDVPLKILKNI